MKVIIAGSRTLTLSSDDIQAAIVLSGFAVTEIVSGHCSGIDISGEAWARRQVIPFKIYPADWDKHGRAAGPIRNRHMANYADCLIAIYRRDNLTPGTRNMIKEARRHFLSVYEHTV